MIAGILCGSVALGLSVEGNGGKEAASTVVGMDTCVSCHADYDTALAVTPHRTLLAEDSGAEDIAPGCEACHGPGSAHIEDSSKGVVNFKSEDGRDFARQCLACHAANPKLSRWEYSDHGKSGVFCNECHQTHKSSGGETKKRDAAELCASCHMDIEAQFSQTSHHPVPEGKMTCVSCHNPHDENAEADAFTSSAQSCASCHTEKAGPFKFQHDPAAENCLNCHTPHGSASDKLTTTRVPNLCLQCHTDALLIHQAPSSTASLRNCLDCHKKTHGSNASEKLFF